MHKYYLRLVYNHSCPQSFHGLSNVKGISFGQYDSSMLTFTGHLHLIGIMLKARGAKRKPHHLSSRSPESNGREKQINTQLQQAVLNCQERHTNTIGANGRDFITMRIMSRRPTVVRCVNALPIIRAAQQRDLQTSRTAKADRPVISMLKKNV